MLSLRRYFLHFCQSRQAFPLTLLAGLILVLPSLWSGLFADDFTHVVLIREGSLVRQPDNLSLFHLFSFIDTQPERLLQLRGLSIMPWWISEHFSLLFFRPLSELTHYLDYQYLYPHVGLMHLHSLLWYAILLAMLAWFYQTFCQSRQLALLALLFFIADATHGFTVAWLANRNAMLAAIFTLLALISHHRFRHTRKPAWQILSLLGIACCFLSAEAGIVVGAFLFAYAVFLDRAGPARGLLALAPALLIFLAWLLLYKQYGYGAHGNKAYYVDPLSSPVLFLLNLPERLLRTIAIQFNPLPIHLARPFRPLMTVAGLAFLILLLLPALRSQNRHYRFFLCSMLLAIIPITSAEVQDRNMLFVGIAASPILAIAIRYLSHAGQRRASVLAALILFFHLPVSALLMLPTSYGPKLMAHSSVTTAASLSASTEQQYLISLGIPVFDASYIAAIRRSQSLPLPQRLWNVSTQTRGLSIERIDSHRFRLSNPDGILGGIDFMLRDMSFDPLRTGETFNLNGLVLGIEALNDAGTPVQVSLQIDPGIAESQLHLCYWKNMRLETFSLAVGEIRTF